MLLRQSVKKKNLYSCWSWYFGYEYQGSVDSFKCIREGDLATDMCEEAKADLLPIFMVTELAADLNNGILA